MLERAFEFTVATLIVVAGAALFVGLVVVALIMRAATWALDRDA